MAGSAVAAMEARGTGAGAEALVAVGMEVAAQEAAMVVEVRAKEVAGVVARAVAREEGAPAAVGEVAVGMEVAKVVAMEEALAVVQAGPTVAKGTAEG